MKIGTGIISNAYKYIMTDKRTSWRILKAKDMIMSENETNFLKTTCTRLRMK